MAKKVNQEVEITITNNFYGAFCYSRKNGDSLIDFSEHGDETTLTFGELKRELSKLKHAFNDFTIIITGVEDENDEATLESVISELRLTDAYNELLSLSDEKLSEVDYIDIDIISDFAKEADSEEIHKILFSKKSKLSRTIAETITILYKESQVSDYNKMKDVAEHLGYKNTDHFWGEIQTEA